EALADKPADMAVTVHMCRGNYQSAWFSSVGYDFVAEAVFGGLKVDGLFLEYDDEPPASQRAATVSGPRSTARGTSAERRREDIVPRRPGGEREDRASKYVDLDRLCLSGQCGFASTVEGNSLTIDEERAKLELITSVAGEVWG